MALATVVGNVAVVHAQKTAAPAPLVFDNVTVIDVKQGTHLSAQRVVIAGNRIRTVGSVNAVPLPAGALVVDARGKYLIPGLWDMHTHSRRSAAFFYPLFIANGVTGIRDAGSEVPIDTLIMWRREIVAGTRVGPPRQILSGQSIRGPEQGCVRSKTNDAPETCITDSSDARHFVDSIKAAGADMIKPRAVARDMYFVIAAESRRLGIPFGGHAQEETAIEASDSGASIVDHMQYAMGARGIGVICWGAKATVEQCQPVAERFRHNGTWFVPTLTRDDDAGHTTYAPQIFSHFTERARAFWAGSLLHGNWFRDSISSSAPNASHPSSPGGMSIIHQVGLPVLAGTDVGAPVMKKMPPGFSLHAELAMYVAEGLTPLEALQSATLNPATFLHSTDSLGTVASGKLADLVLLDADPLTDITNTTTIHAVVANGHYFDRTALDKLLTEVQTKAK
jgi:hypothetical protein